MGLHLACPKCAGGLRPWGWARFRKIRHGTGAGQDLVEHHPCRARCAGCAATHVLLTVSSAVRRADSAEVIASAIEAKTAKGQGHRVIAAWLDRPASTVRDRLLDFSRCAPKITGMFTALVLRDAPDAARIWPSTCTTWPTGQLSEPLTLVTAACAGSAGVAANASAAQMPIAPRFRVFVAFP